MGDRAANIATAVSRIGALPKTRLVQVSSIVETEPVGPAGQGLFLNGVAEIETKLEADELLDALQEIEAALGRVRAERWGPRPIDLDLLLYDDKVIDTPGLQVPHPRMTEREFVLAPLAEIAPDTVHPSSGKSVGEMLADLRRRSA